LEEPGRDEEGSVALLYAERADVGDHARQHG
jgi:hypothetical protein